MYPVQVSVHAFIKYEMHSNILHVCDHLLDHMGRKKTAQKIDELSTLFLLLYYYYILSLKRPNINNSHNNAALKTQYHQHFCLYI